MDGYTKVPDAVLEQVEAGNLDAINALLLSVVSRRSQREGFCWASNTDLAKLLGLSADWTRRRIADLVQKGFLISNVDRRSGNVRKLTLTPKAKDLFGGMVEGNHPMGVDNHTYGRGQPYPMGVDNHIIKNLKDKEKSTASGGGLHAPARSGGREAEPQSRFTLTTGEDGVQKYVMNPYTGGKHGDRT